MKEWEEWQYLIGRRMLRSAEWWDWPVTEDGVRAVVVILVRAVVG